MVKGISHIGIVVKNIDDVLSFLREFLGAEEVRRTSPYLPPVRKRRGILRKPRGKRSGNYWKDVRRAIQGRVYSPEELKGNSF